MNRDRRRLCPRCSSGYLVEDFEKGEIVCPACGFIMVEKKEVMMRPRTEDERHHGDEQLLQYGGGHLGTVIGNKNRDYTGRSLNLDKSPINSMRILDRRTRVSDIERRVERASFDLRATADKLGTPTPVLERALQLYRKASERRIVAGRSVAVIAHACLYAAYREAGIPRTLRDIAETAKLKEKDIAKGYRLIFFEFNISPPVVDLKKVISKAASALSLRGETERLAYRIYDAARKKGNVDGKHPLSLVAASVYLAGVLTEDNVTQSKVADAVNVTEVTIRNRCRSLVQELSGLKSLSDFRFNDWDGARSKLLAVVTSSNG